MGDRSARRGGGWWLVFLALLVLSTAAVAAYFYLGRPVRLETPRGAAPVLSSPQQSAALTIEDFCSRCHPYPPADTFPRSAWKGQAEKAYKPFTLSSLYVTPPPIGAVSKQY